MKRLYFILFTLLCAMAAHAQEIQTVTTKELFKEVEKIEHVKDIKINPFMMSIARVAAPDNSKEMLKQVNSMRMFFLGECSKEDIQRFTERISGVEINGFEKPVEETSENDARSRVFMKTKGDYIEEVIVATLDKENTCLIYMKGELTQETLIKMSQRDSIPQ